MKFKLLCFLLLFTYSAIAFSQNAEIKSTDSIGSLAKIDSSIVDTLNPKNITFEYGSPKRYFIGGITFEGIKNLDRFVLKTITGLEDGKPIDVPGDAITKAIQNLWKQGLFSEVKISASKIIGDKIYLEIFITEKPRLSSFKINGVKKGDVEKLTEKIKLSKGIIVTENLLMTTRNIVKKYYEEDGFYFAEITTTVKSDSISPEKAFLTINIKKNHRVRIQEIQFTGAEIEKADKADPGFIKNLLAKTPPDMTSDRLKGKMKETKQRQWFNPFRNSKFVEKDFIEDKTKVIGALNEKGFRDAQIKKDSIYKINDKRIGVKIAIEEGHKYYFRNISWLGNSKYRSEDLTKVLSIKKGDVYNQTELDTRLFMNQSGGDISSLYLDDGYLFFSVTPVEVSVQNDSIDLEMRIYEGKQATINKITITGNTKTNDHVIMREIRTKPGELFKRKDIIRSQRELAQLGYFNPEKLNVNPTPNPVDGTVDIEYIVAEKPSDQLELSGGWGANNIVGTIGVSFNNFSAKKVFHKDAWTPIPSGDGQKIGVRAQSYGLGYQSYNLHFTEPWLGGRKPNSLTSSIFYTHISNVATYATSSPNYGYSNILGTSVGLGKRLKWPDDFFTLYQELSYMNYNIHNYSSYTVMKDGQSNSITYTMTLSRNSTDQMIFPRMGSNIALTGMFTPPYSLFTSKDYTNLSAEDKFRWNEFYKIKVTSSWFTRIVGDLVLNSKINYGFLGCYNSTIGVTPFQRFYVGGDGLTGYMPMQDRELVGLRGYPNQTLTPRDGAYNQIGGTIYDKYTLELRYPVSLNPTATIFGLVFAEAGNAWSKFSDFKPFDVKRSVGVGVRIFMPMFGMLGLDYGYGFDNTDYPVPGTTNPRGNFHFTIGQQF